MKKAVLLFFIFVSLNGVLAETSQPVDIQSAIPQSISFTDCTKMYNLNKEVLFFLTLEAINANKYMANEIQTNNGYIIFTAAKSRYLASIAGIDKDNSILKITPCNNLYYFRKEILNSIYNYIDLNRNKELK